MMTKRSVYIWITIILLIFAIAGCVNSGKSQNVVCKQDKTQDIKNIKSFIGLHYVSFPKGISDLIGFVVGGNEKENEANLGIDYVSDKKGTMIWLSQMSYQKGCSNPENVVVDYRRIPKLAENEIFIANCRIGDVSNGGDGHTFAIAIEQNKEILHTIRMAWQVNIKTRKIIAVSPINVQCINEGFDD